MEVGSPQIPEGKRVSSPTSSFCSLKVFLLTLSFKAETLPYTLWGRLKRSAWDLNSVLNHCLNGMSLAKFQMYSVPSTFPP